MKHSFGVFVLAIGFLLGLYGGRLALFSGVTGRLMQVFPVYGASLPAQDQEALSAGIPVDSEAALSQYLEDFLS